MKTISIARFVFFLLLVLIVSACKKDDNKNDKKYTIECSAGCSDMSWSIDGETGGATFEESCDIEYQGYDYIETCTGTATYHVSGHVYNYDAIYDWVNCEITINIDGVGSCTHNANTKKTTSCDCNVNMTNAYIKHKYE